MHQSTEMHIAILLHRLFCLMSHHMYDFFRVLDAFMGDVAKSKVPMIVIKQTNLKMVRDRYTELTKKCSAEFIDLS